MNCKFCGCDELHACVTDDGPCYWHRPQYCSACADKHLDQLVDVVSRWIAPTPSPITGSIASRPCTVVESEESLLVLDHIGMRIFFLTSDGCELAPHYDALELLELFQPEKRAA